MKINRLWGCLLASLLTACSPVKLPISNMYTLQASHPQRASAKHTALTLLVSPPDATAGYQTNHMLYVTKPFELSAFAHNSWISAPANLIHMLMLQHFEQSQFFRAVVSGPYAGKTDYRVDATLMQLQQNFLVKPSVIELMINVVITQTEGNRVIASHLFHQQKTCPKDTPYGGVLAANQVVQSFTTVLSDFVTRQVLLDQLSLGEKK